MKFNNIRLFVYFEIEKINLLNLVITRFKRFFLFFDGRRKISGYRILRIKNKIVDLITSIYRVNSSFENRYKNIKKLVSK